MIFASIYVLMLFSYLVISDEVNSDSPSCPRECNCEVASLRSAPFVLTWMTSWGEDDLPDLHPNEILNAGMMTSSGTASDAGVDVDVVGLHATCSLHSTTNITTLLSMLPSSTMVLSILQAPGCNLTIIDGGQLVGLRSLKALHLQGYAHRKQKQVSGFEPNSVPELIAHKELLKQEVNKNQEDMRDLRLALAEDALQPLTDLQLLDLQFVRLVASKEARRSRRYSKEPIASTTLLDMPLKQFLQLANKVDSFYLPAHLQKLNKENGLKGFIESDEHMINRIEHFSDSYKLQRNLFENKNEQIEEEKEENVPDKFDIEDPPKMELKSKRLEDDKNIVPYSIYVAEMQPQLAPFQKLKQLKYLRVAHALLDRIGAELLDGLQQLHTLTLEYNKIKILPAGLFAPTPNLRHLSLAHNNVLLLDPDSLEGLSKLLTIDLDHNELSVLGPATFPALQSLKTLRINENPLTHLLPDTFGTLNSTENIYLGSYNISMDVHEHSFRFLYSLKSLVLNNISLESLQKTLLLGMPGVEHLTFHGKIPEIDYDAFSTTPNLRSLNISHCHLSLLSLDSFFGLRRLVKLDLSHNKLVAISPGTFDHLTNLRELYLNDNLLMTIPLGIFIPIPAKLIQLQNNPWYCTCDLLQLRPSITNKIKRFGHVVCEWDDKLATVCKKTKSRFVYDARVAPLCHEPSELSGTDVYHAALRHLKCSKYHWDPRLLQKKKNEKDALNIEKANKLEEKIPKEDEPEEKVNWLPLTAFTPEPIDTEDLLEIAEQEGLEEVIEDQPESTTVNTNTAMKSNDDKEDGASFNKSSKNAPQNDQPTNTRAKLHNYRTRKMKIKALMKSKNEFRRKYKKLFLKKTHPKEKKLLKAAIANKQKEIYRSKKLQEDREFADNFIRRGNLKSNVDIYRR